MLSKALLGFSVPDNQPSMTAHYGMVRVTVTVRVWRIVQVRFIVVQAWYITPEKIFPHAN